MSDGPVPSTVERRLGQIEHLLNEVLERHARASVKDRLSIERTIEKVALDLSDHRNTTEATGKFFTTERINESELDHALFMRGQEGWELATLSYIPTDLSNAQENLFLVVFRQEDKIK